MIFASAGATDTAEQATSPLVPLLVLAVSIIVLFVAHWLLLARGDLDVRKQFGRQLSMILLTLVAAVATIVSVPSDYLRDGLLAVMGLMVAISSTSFVSNAMAGLMLRAVKNLRPGDFIRVGDQFGRVTVRGLFHTEIQTEDSDLSTLPNMYLVSQPVTVVRSTGTFISCILSLGYDVPRTEIAKLLIRAAEFAELTEPFVYVTELGDFAVTYRIAARLQDVQHLLSARSRLRESVLDALHGAGIEIVSPTFMNQRQLVADRRIVPVPQMRYAEGDEKDSPPEKSVFDKAEHAHWLETLQDDRDALREEIKELEAQSSETDESTLNRIERQIDRKRRHLQWIETTLRAEKETSSKD